MESLSQQLDRVIKEKGIKVHYPTGYHEWKQRFETAFRNTRSVQKSLEIADNPKYIPQPPQQ